MNKIDIIMLCGGKGTRFADVTEGKLPKSLFVVGEEALLGHSIKHIDFKHVNKIIFAVNYEAAKIEKWVRSLELPIEFVFSYQEIDGIMPAILGALKKVSTSQFGVCNTDEVRENFSFNDLYQFHTGHHKAATMVGAYSDNLINHRVVYLDEVGRVVSSELKSPLYRDDPTKTSLVNTGFWLFDRAAIPYFTSEGSLEWNNVVDPLINSGQLYCFVMPKVAYFNVGTKAEYKQAEKYLDKH